MKHGRQQAGAKRLSWMDDAIVVRTIFASMVAGVPAASLTWTMIGE